MGFKLMLFICCSFMPIWNYMVTEECLLSHKNTHMEFYSLWFCYLYLFPCHYAVHQHLLIYLLLSCSFKYTNVICNKAVNKIIKAANILLKVLISQLAVPWWLERVILDQLHELFYCSVDCFVYFDFWEIQSWNVKTDE